MLRVLLCILLLFFISPAIAGDYENAIKENDKVFLYLYSDNCSYCIKFNPIYEKIVSKFNKLCKFVKVNAHTRYGYSLVSSFNAKYLPYVLLVDTKSLVITYVTPDCLINEACVNKVVNNFIK